MLTYYDIFTSLNETEVVEIKIWPSICSASYFLETHNLWLTAENGTIQGSITGVPASSVANKLWLAFQALGDIAFAYPYAMILLEIQVWFWYGYS